MQQLYASTVAEKGNKDEADNPIPEWRIIQAWKYSYSSLFVLGMAGEELRNPLPFTNIISNVVMNQYGVTHFPGQWPGKALYEFGHQMYTGETQEQLGKDKAAETRKEKVNQ